MQKEDFFIQGPAYPNLSDYARHLAEQDVTAYPLLHIEDQVPDAVHSSFRHFLISLSRHQYKDAQTAWDQYINLYTHKHEMDSGDTWRLRREARYRFLSPVKDYTAAVDTAVLLLREAEDFLSVPAAYLETLNQLQEHERLYRQAEELANIGNWQWHTQTNKVEWTDHLYKIYGLEPQSQEMNVDVFLSFVHPDDRNIIGKALKNTTEEFYDYTFRIITPKGDVKTLRSIAKVQKRNEAGEPLLVVGTERDVTEKQALIDRLKRSETLYKQAQALAHVGNWTWDLPTGKIEWSDELFRIFDLEPQSVELTIEKYMELMQYDRPQEDSNRFERLIKEGKPYEFYRTIQINGKTKHLHAHGETLFDKEGKAYKLVGTAQDVTETYRIQQELKDNQHLITKIADAAPSIISSYHAKTGAYTYVNRGIEKILGYTVEEVMQHGTAFLLSIVHPDDLSGVADKDEHFLEETDKDCLEQDIIQENTYRVKHKNGQYRWIHSYGTVFDRDERGCVEHILNVSLDVTGQMEATDKIKEQEHFIQQIADASPTILYLYDVEQQSMVYINREIYFVLGYLPEEIIETGENVTQLIYHPEDRHLLPGRTGSGKTFQQVDSMIQYECRIKNKEGEWRWLLIREIVFKSDDNGNIRQILGAALDINPRKEMEKTILQNSMLLEQSNASLEEFAYVASHDLKEPLRKISTFGDRLVASQMDSLTGDGKVYLKKIVDASQRMQTMISDLLSISMIKGNTSFEPYSLQKILEETLQTLEFKIEQQDAVVKSDPLPDAMIIPSQFRQLFQNLLSNSLKFISSELQPEIYISYTRISRNDLPNYSLKKSDCYHRLDFKDNGIGFEPEFAGKIFAIFQRLHGRSEYEGSGIGLAICKKIVEHHGGIIYAGSTMGQGATFTIILPE